MTAIEHSAELAKAGANITTRWQGAMFLARHYPLGAAGGIILIIFVLTAIFAGSLSPFDPTLTNSGASLARPGVAHWLGADFMGRDMYSRIVHGARISLAVGAGAMSLGALIGISVGLASGYLGGWFDLLVLLLFVQVFGWIPIYNKPADSFWKEIGLLSIPALVVGFRSSALMMRLTRSSMLEVLRQDYIRTARSKGASEPSVNYDHALRNAMLPVITIIGIEAAFLIGGLIVTETVFNIPGVARFLVEAIRWRDYPIVQNLVMFIAFVVVTINFVVDMAYAVLDPRIKYES